MIALGAAVLGALAYGIGSVLQAFAAQRATGVAVLRHPFYLLGVGFDLVAFAASLVAVRDLPLFAVQSVLAASLGVTVVLARFVLGTPLRRRDGAAIVGVIAALVVLALASGSQSAQLPPSWFTGAVLAGVASTAGVLLVCYRRGHAIGLAMLAGASFAGSAIGARGLDLTGGWLAALGHPTAWTIVTFGLIGSVAYARSLEHGSLGSSTATVWVVEVALAGLVGIAVLGDGVLPGWGPPALGAIAVAGLGCVLLARVQPDTPPLVSLDAARTQETTT